MPEPIQTLEPRISIVTLLVSDMPRSYRFYAEGLGFPTTRKATDDWVGFKLQGLCFALYAYDAFAGENLTRRLDAGHALDRGVLPALTLAYNTRHKHEVDQVLQLAQQAGGTIEKQPQIASWGGYSGYFADPDGHLWEVAWAESWDFNEDGSLVVA